MLALTGGGLLPPAPATAAVMSSERVLPKHNASPGAQLELDVLGHPHRHQCPSPQPQRGFSCDSSLAEVKVTMETSWNG